MTNFDEVLCAPFRMELVCVGEGSSVRVGEETIGTVRVIAIGASGNGKQPNHQDDTKDESKNLFSLLLLSLSKTVG